jgi:hypothetical protein
MEQARHSQHEACAWVELRLTAPIATAQIKPRARRGDEVALHMPRGAEIIEVLSVSYQARLLHMRMGWAQPVASPNPWIPGSSEVVIRCQVIGETNSGCKGLGVATIGFGTVEPHQARTSPSGRRAPSQSCADKYLLQWRTTP